MSSNSNGHLSHPLNMAVDTASQLPSGASVCANPADTSAASEAMEHSSESSSDKEGGRGEGAGSWDLCQDDPSAASEASVPDGFTLLNKAPGKMQQRPWARHSTQQLDACKISIMIFNLLAHSHTHHNWLSHGASERRNELSGQKDERYKKSKKIVVRAEPDIVLLQECDADFIIKAQDLHYHIFAAGDNKNPGTAVLVKKTLVEEKTSMQCTNIGGTEKTGYKTATLVKIQIFATTFYVVSVHFAGGDNFGKRIAYAQLIEDQLPKEIGKGEVSILLGGDFNCQPERGLKYLSEHTFICNLHRVKLSEKSMTGLSADFKTQVCIDHFYYYLSHSLEAKSEEARTLADQGEPKSPWTNGTVSGASDHVPVLVELVLGAREKAHTRSRVLFWCCRCMQTATQPWQRSSPSHLSLSRRSHLRFLSFVFVPCSVSFVLRCCKAQKQN